jgi:hypothetical protein
MLEAQYVFIIPTIVHYIILIWDLFDDRTTINIVWLNSICHEKINKFNTIFKLFTIRNRIVLSIYYELYDQLSTVLHSLEISWYSLKDQTSWRLTLILFQVNHYTLHNHLKVEINEVILVPCFYSNYKWQRVTLTQKKIKNVLIYC